MKQKKSYKVRVLEAGMPEGDDSTGTLYTDKEVKVGDIVKVQVPLENSGTKIIQGKVIEILETN